MPLRRESIVFNNMTENDDKIEGQTQDCVFLLHNSYCDMGHIDFIDFALHSSPLYIDTLVFIKVGIVAVFLSDDKYVIMNT